jgi:hypothetical protein
MRRTAVVAVLLGALAPLVGAAGAARAATGVVSLSEGPSSTYVDKIGLTHIVGYLHNSGVDVEAAKSTVELLDASGAILKTDDVYVLNDVIRTGENSPFDYPFTPPTGYSSYRLVDPTANPTLVTAQREARITITATDKTGGSPYLVHGTVTNPTQDTWLAAKIELIFVDGAGITRYVAGTIAENDRFNFDVAPGASASWYVPYSTDQPTTWTTILPPVVETPIFTPTPLAPASPTRIATAPGTRSRSLGLGTIGHTPVLDAPAVAPSTPLPDERKALTPQTVEDPVASTLTTAANPHSLGKALTWSSLLIPVLGAAGVLALIFLVTLVFLAFLRLRATDPGRPRV